MILVIFEHIIWFSICCENNTEYLVLFNLIKHFLMPLFMFLSGLVVSEHPITLKNFKSDCHKRIRYLIIPFLFFGLIYTLAIGLKSTDFLFSNMKCGYWYLLVLFYMYLLHNLFLCICKKKSYLFEGSFVICIYLSLIILHRYLPNNINSLLSLQQLIILYFYFFGGVIIKRHRLHDICFKNNWTCLVAIVSLFLFLALGKIDIMGHCQLFTMGIIITIMSILMLVEKESSRVYRLLQYIGRHTLDIYVLHYFFIHFLNITFVANLLIFNPIMGLAIITPPSILIALMSIQIGKNLKKNEIFRMVVFYR